MEMAARSTKITPFLMFNETQAEQAMQFYVSVFPARSKVLSVTRYGEGHGADKVKQGRLLLCDQELILMDSLIKHGFTFTPSISMFVECVTEAEIDDLFAQLSAGGSILMPLEKYPFAAKFAWISDKYSISWQLILS